LGIPRDLNRAAELIASGQPLAVDVGLAGGRVFMVALATGSLSRMMETANYETKQALGYFAYILGAYQSVVNPPTLAIRLTIDGRIIEREGIALAVSNTGNVGAKGVYIPRGTSIRDGLLDITVFRGADLETLFAMAGSAFDLGDLAPPLQRWRGESIHIDFDQPQAIAFDGDILMKTPVSVEVRQHALNVIMPSDPQTLYPKFWSSRLHDP
jgi:diacylglycerol kinase (ATP)